MAENRNITWNVTLYVNQGVKTPCNLYLKESTLTDGKWSSNPPSDIVAPAPGGSVVISFKAEGRECSSYGTAGVVIYESDDNVTNPTIIKIEFNIPMYDANSGNMFFGSGAANGTYTINNAGGVPKSGNSITMDVSITQIKPTV